jgi:hypothetical protein
MNGWLDLIHQGLSPWKKTPSFAWRTLCTLQSSCSASASVTIATLGMNDWLGLIHQGLSPWKKRQAALGAPTVWRTTDQFFLFDMSLIVFLVGTRTGEGDLFVETIPVEQVIDEFGAIIGVNAEQIKG